MLLVPLVCKQTHVLYLLPLLSALLKNHKRTIAIHKNQWLLSCVLKFTRAFIMNGLSGNITSQDPDTNLCQKGVEIHSHLHPVGRQDLGTCSRSFTVKDKVVCEWLPGSCRLSYPAVPVAFIAAGAPCSGTLHEPRHGCHGLPRGSERAGGFWPLLTSCTALPSFIGAI